MTNQTIQISNPTFNKVQNLKSSALEKNSSNSWMNHIFKDLSLTLQNNKMLVGGALTSVACGLVTYTFAFAPTIIQGIGESKSNSFNDKPDKDVRTYQEINIGKDRLSHVTIGIVGLGILAIVTGLALCTLKNTSKSVIKKSQLEQNTQHNKHLENVLPKTSTPQAQNTDLAAPLAAPLIVTQGTNSEASFLLPVNTLSFSAPKSEPIKETLKFVTSALQISQQQDKIHAPSLQHEMLAISLSVTSCALQISTTAPAMIGSFGPALFETQLDLFSPDISQVDIENAASPSGVTVLPQQDAPLNCLSGKSIEDLTSPPSPLSVNTLAFNTARIAERIIEPAQSEIRATPKNKTTSVIETNQAPIAKEDQLQKESSTSQLQLSLTETQSLMKMKLKGVNSHADVIRVVMRTQLNDNEDFRRQFIAARLKVIFNQPVRFSKLEIERYIKYTAGLDGYEEYHEKLREIELLLVFCIASEYKVNFNISPFKEWKDFLLALPSEIKDSGGFGLASEYEFMEVENLHKQGLELISKKNTKTVKDFISELNDINISSYRNFLATTNYFSSTDFDAELKNIETDSFLIGSPEKINMFSELIIKGASLLDGEFLQRWTNEVQNLISKYTNYTSRLSISEIIDNFRASIQLKD